MMALPTPAAAALNNALWCDAVCRAHGLPTALDGALWLCAGAAPMFYPNIVILSASTSAAQVGAAAASIEAGLAGPWAIKDSFAALDLSPLGFAPLFDATWIARPAGNREGAAHGLAWQAVRGEEALAAWEAAWAAADSVAPARVFLPPLLSDPSIRFLAAYRGARLVAGGILSRTGQGAEEVLGISNTFALPGEDARACWIEVAGMAAGYAPGLPLVGYESGEWLAWALEAGFAALHPLRVWARSRDF